MSVRIINADVLAGLAELPDESVHCVVTSPPYWGLRDYGTGTWEGGDQACDHVSHEIRTGLGMEALGAKYSGGGKKAAQPKPVQFRASCGKCGAVKVDSQIGLEATPAEFVARMVEVFREVRRVLRKDGTCWMNLGDSYATGTTAARGSTMIDGDHVPAGWAGRSQPVRCGTPSGLKTKDLIGIPWRVALALQADGWWLRQDVIWHKPNPMPESVTDRCTKAHEYVFLLTKSASYFYDAEAIKEPGSDNSHGGGKVGDRYSKGAGRRDGSGIMCAKPAGDDGRNKRSVWTISTAPFAEAHFATFPPQLPELCIKAGCPVGGTVLDPFGGAGTTGLVADRLQRHAILIELNPEYAAMAERRINGDRGGLLDIMEAAQ